MPRSPVQKAGRPLGKRPGRGAASPPPFHSLCVPRGSDDGHPHENMALLPKAALLTVARRWTQPKRPLADAQISKLWLGAWWATGQEVTQSRTRLKRLSAHVPTAVRTTGCHQSRNTAEALTEPSDDADGDAGQETACCPTAPIRNGQKRRVRADSQGRGAGGESKGIRAFFGDHKNILECSQI